MGTNEVPRLRLGIAGQHLRPGDEKADYVLSRFSKAERPVVDEGVGVACDALEAFLTQGLESAMNRFNRPPEEVPAG
jgi:PTH1 family peptidyl-tRNA hydrolase